MSSQSPSTAPVWLKPAVDYGPLIAFFAAYMIYGLLPATAVLIVASAFALGLSVAIERRVPWMPVITAIAVGVFGGLTLWLQDDRFIKIKPTVIQGLFAVALIGGLAFNRPLLKPLLGAGWPMDDLGWRRLTVRFAAFFAAMALLNEVVWRTQTTDVWVTFKVFGLLGLTLVFSLLQIPLMTRHRLPDPDEESEA